MLAEDFKALGIKKLLVVTIPFVLPSITAILDELTDKKIVVKVFDDITSEPTLETVDAVTGTRLI